MDFVQHDGGRNKYYKGGRIGDCVIRAIALGTEQDYKTVYMELMSRAIIAGSMPNEDRIWKRYLKDLGWVETKLGRSAVDLKDTKLPNKCIAVTSGHLCAVMNNTLLDNWDGRFRKCWRYWTKS